MFKLRSFEIPSQLVDNALAAKSSKIESADRDHAIALYDGSTILLLALIY